MKVKLAIVFGLFTNVILSQENIPCYGAFLEKDAALDVVNDSVGFWFTPKADTTIRGFISLNKRIYRHYRKSTMQLLVEGDFGGRIYTDAHMRFGKWTEFFEDGSLKTVGHYYMNSPIGLWQFYYAGGQLREAYTLVLFESAPSSNFCKAGLYEAYYPNGQIRVRGFYKAAVDSTTEVRFDPISTREYTAECVKPVSKPFGLWIYYSENGQIESQEEFGEFIHPAIWYYER